MIGYKNIPGHLWTVNLNKGVYEISPISAKWDKEGPFNETKYHHFLNLGFTVDQSIGESQT